MLPPPSWCAGPVLPDRHTRADSGQGRDGLPRRLRRQRQPHGDRKDATLIGGARRGGWPPAHKASIAYTAALVAITIGLVVWRRRPESRTGILLTAFPFAGLLADLPYVFPRSAMAVTLGFAVALLPAAILVHAVLSYPTGRLTARVERGFVVLAYAFAAVYALPLLLFYDPRAPNYQFIWEWPSHAVPFTHVAWKNVSGIRHALDLTTFTLAIVFIGLLVRKLLRATPGGRRVILPLVAAACFGAVQFAAQIGLYGSQVNSWTSSGWFWIVEAAALAVPLALAAGLLWGRSAQSAAADLVVALQRTPPGAVRDALARTLGDPSLELALWLPERGTYVDAGGRPL